MDFRIVAALSATAVAVPLSAGPASADPVLNGEFTVSGVGTNNQIAVGPDGNMWVTLESVTKDVAKITPDGTVTEYESANMSNPIGITAGPDGNLWVTQAGGVARFAPADPTTATPFAIAAIADPRAITTGPDGNLWTASADKAFKIPPANPGGFTPYPATGLSGARWITASSDGYLWVADFGVPQAVRIATDGTGTVFPALGGLQGIAGGAAGQVAYSQQGAAPYYVGVLTPPGPEKTAPMPGADPFGVTYGADGAYWVARFATNNVARVTADAQSSTIALPANSGPRQIAAGPNDTVWVTLDNTDKIARITGVSAPVPTPTPTPTPTPGTNPDTKITKAPKKVVRTKKARAKVKVRFTGTDGATFQCKVVRKPKTQASVKWRTCTSPKTVRLRKGKYTFLVRAVTSTGRDGSPAKTKFRVKRR